jgi:hypothetical protein
MRPACLDAAGPDDPDLTFTASLEYRSVVD